MTQGVLTGDTKCGKMKKDGEAAAVAALPRGSCPTHNPQLRKSKMDNKIHAVRFDDVRLDNTEVEAVSAKTCLDGVIAMFIDDYKTLCRCHPDAGEAWPQNDEAQEERRVAWRNHERAVLQLSRQITRLRSKRSAVIDHDIALTCEQRGKPYDQLERDVTHFSAARHTFTEGRWGKGKNWKNKNQRNA